MIDSVRLLTPSFNLDQSFTSKMFAFIKSVYGFLFLSSLKVIISFPLMTGFEESRTGCCGTGRFEMSFLCDPHSPFTCQDADKYVFWDAFHPSEKTNRMITDHLLKTSLAKFL